MADAAKLPSAKRFITQLVNRAAKGDWRGAKLILDIEQDIERRTDAAAPPAADFGEADKKVIKQLMTRLNRNKGGSDD